MDDLAAKPLCAFGFLTAVETSDHGVFGGYLVLSARGLPLEFRCSTPIRPTRAQEILYGRSLRPHLLGEVIGRTLVTSSQAPAQIIFTDQRDILALASSQRTPLVVVTRQVHTAAFISQGRDGIQESAFEFGEFRLELDESSPLAEDAICQLLAPLPPRFDLSEPFERIRIALAEAQQAPDIAAPPSQQPLEAA